MFCNCRIVMQICHHWSWHTVWLVLRKVLRIYDHIFKSSPNLKARRSRDTYRHGYTSSKWWHKGPHFWLCLLGGYSRSGCGSGYSHFCRIRLGHGCPHSHRYTSTHSKGGCPCNLCLWWGLRWLWWHRSTSIGGFSHYFQGFTTS